MAEEIKAFLRIMNTDLEGNKPINRALLKIKGVGFSLSNAICIQLNINKNQKAGLLSDVDTKKINDLLTNSNLPPWMLNRRSDFDTGEDKHLTGSDLKFTKELDIKKERRLKSYRGVRHAAGLPVRGQRTRGHFRKSGKAVGVQRAKIAQAKSSKPTTKSGGKPSTKPSGVKK